MEVQDGLPMSCCATVSGAINNISCTLETKGLYSHGCLDAVAEFIKSHAVDLGIAGLGVAALQVSDC